MAERYVDIEKLRSNGGAPPGAWIDELGRNDDGRPHQRGVIDRVLDFFEARAEASRSRRERAGSGGEPPADHS